MKRKAGCVAALLALLAGAAPLGAAEKVTLGRPTDVSLADAPLVMALGMGYFGEEGLDVEIVPFKGSAALLAAVATKRVRIGLLDPAFLVRYRQPDRPAPPVMFFYDLVRAAPWRLVVAETGPIATLADLKGRRVGVGALAFEGVPMLGLLLREIGPKPEGRVETVPVGLGASALQALTDGRVEALHLADVQQAALEAGGARLRRIDLPVKYAALPGEGLVAHRDSIEGEVEMLARFGRAVAKGSVACDASPSACLSRFRKRYPGRLPEAPTDADGVILALRILNARLEQIMHFANVSAFGAFPAGVWRNLVTLMQRTGEIPTADLAPESLYTNRLVDGFNRFYRDEVVEAARAVQ